MPSAHPSRRSHTSNSAPVAVLIDGSALFLAVKALFDRHLDYKAFAVLLQSRLATGAQHSSSQSAARWVMWTSVSSKNEGQARFLDFTENQLGWEVRRFTPAESYVVEPNALFGAGSDDRGAWNRLLRFDASISFALGRLAENHRIVVVSDGYSLADPMIRAGRAGNGRMKPLLAFFGRGLDPRWQHLLRVDPEGAPEFLDLDDYESELFGVAPTRSSVRAPIEEDFVF